MSAAACPFCAADATGGAVFVAAERMYGMGGRFHYRECPHCGSLWLENAPDLAAFYPQDYYAFTPASAGQSRSERIVRLLRTVVDRLEWTVPFLAGPRHVISLARSIGIGRDSTLLDVGCGSGSFLRRLKRLGLRDLTGVDPNVPESVDEPGLRIVRGVLEDVEGRFDAIFCNHSLEHAPDPMTTLAHIRSRLLPGGVIVIRIPVVAYAWQRFRECWVQLDAPRHQAIPSSRGMLALTQRVGLRIERVVYDSTAFQFWGSRAYERGASLKSVLRQPLTLEWFGLVASNAVRSLQAAYLNTVGRGDQAAFVCRPANERS